MFELGDVSICAEYIYYNGYKLLAKPWIQFGTISSLPSPQLLSPSHVSNVAIHFPLEHRKVFCGQAPGYRNVGINCFISMHTWKAE